MAGPVAQRSSGKSSPNMGQSAHQLVTRDPALQHIPALREESVLYAENIHGHQGRRLLMTGVAEVRLGRTSGVRAP